MARLRLLGPAREAAGVAEVELEGEDVAAVLDEARARFGPGFAELLGRSAIWLNGSPATAGQPVGAGDELAVLPPVSGG